MNKYQNSINEGFRSELTFQKIALLKGFDIKEATRNENIYKHIDFHLKKENRIVTIDVKGMKRISRSNINKNNDMVWIELQNVSGNTGWLFGQQDLIAFEQEEYYILVRREVLKNLVLSLLNKNPKNYINNKMVFVDTSYKALYSHYQRKNRQDIITTIKTTDLFTIDHRLWLKK